MEVVGTRTVGWESGCVPVVSSVRGWLRWLWWLERNFRGMTSYPGAALQAVVRSGWGSSGKVLMFSGGVAVPGSGWWRCAFGVLRKQVGGVCRRSLLKERDEDACLKERFEGAC